MTAEKLAVGWLFSARILQIFLPGGKQFTPCRKWGHPPIDRYRWLVSVCVVEPVWRIGEPPEKWFELRDGSRGWAWFRGSGLTLFHFLQSFPFNSSRRAM